MFAVNLTLNINLWIPAASSLSVSPMMDFQIILLNRLHHYVLLVTHHFTNDRVLWKDFPLTADRSEEEGRPAAALN